VLDEAMFERRENAMVDFRYSVCDRLTWWFDHHVSSFPNPGEEAHFRADKSGKKFHDPEAKSCTRFLCRIVQEKFGFDPSPLTSWCTGRRSSTARSSRRAHRGCAWRSRRSS